VVANDLVRDGLGETVEAIESAGGRAMAVLGDVRRREDIEATIAAARIRFGGLDVLLANAAVSVYEDFEHQREETIDLLLGAAAIRARVDLRAAP
jgi:3-oxoacyl-[acyl-carrier protein] reductase